MAPQTAAVTLLPEEAYRRALVVGRSARGVSGPNPPVGCVIVRDGEIVGEGATRPVGEEHAEVVAIAAAGPAAAGATAIVTLEPCAHQGRTPPCTDALISAGIREVHVLLRDPDRAAAGGLERLAASGITTFDVGTERSDLAAAAAHDLRGFLARVRSSRPHVTLKLAQSVDGSTTPPAGQRYLTGAGARSIVHHLRAEVDAVLVGSGTVRSDDPRLDVRLLSSTASPRPVVLATLGDLPLGSRVLRPGAIVLVGPEAPRRRREELMALGASVRQVDATPRGLDLGAALRELLEERILTVLAEPGPRLARGLIAAGAVDLIEVHVAGGVDAHVLTPAMTELAPLMASRDVERIVTDDGDLILRGDASFVASGSASGSRDLGEVA